MTLFSRPIKTRRVRSLLKEGTRGPDDSQDRDLTRTRWDLTDPMSVLGQKDARPHRPKSSRNIAQHGSCATTLAQWFNHSATPAISTAPSHPPRVRYPLPFHAFREVLLMICNDSSIVTARFGRLQARKCPKSRRVAS